MNDMSDKGKQEKDASAHSEEVARNVAALGADRALHDLTLDWFVGSAKHKYSYNFAWLGRPIIQYPQDIVAMQELIWSVQPDLIIETGIAHGGSLIFSASMLELVALSGGKQGAQVLGVDIDIRACNRAAIEAHPMSRRIKMIQGSSIDAATIKQVKACVRGKNRVLVCLDSNHTHEHVLAELRAYAPLVSVGSYCVVFDTVVEDMPEDAFPNRPWGKGNNPKTAVREYLRELQDSSKREGADSLHFEIDESIEDKLLITVAPSGYLRRTS